MSVDGSIAMRSNRRARRCARRGRPCRRPRRRRARAPGIWLLRWWRATGRSRKTTRTRRKTKLCILLHFCVFLRISAQPRRTSLWCDVMGCVRSGHFSALDAHSCSFLRIRCASSRNAPQLHSMRPPKMQTTVQTPCSPGCINKRILDAFKKCAKMRLKCVMKCSILDLATGATGALCIRCIRPLMQKCADNAAEMHTHADKMRTKCVRKNETKSSQKPPHTPRQTH